MRYYLETFTVDRTEYVQLIAASKDFEEFLTRKLEAYPLYITEVEYRKWLIRKIEPQIVTGKRPGRKRLTLHQPICLQFDACCSERSRKAFQEKLLNMLTEWLEEEVREFQYAWKRQNN